MLRVVKNFMKGEEGASLVEYGLLVALIALACIVAITAAGQGISRLFDTVADEMPAAAP